MTKPLTLAQILDARLPEIHIVDVGASFLGEIPRYAATLGSGPYRATLFEPSEPERKKLEAATAPHVTVLPHALGRGGPATLHVTRFPGCTSIYEPNGDVINRFATISAENGPEVIGNFAVVHKEAIETHRLEDIEECPAPDFMKIDVQGAELDVLEGAGPKLDTCLVIELEVEFVEIYKNQPLFCDIQAYLCDKGFQFLKLQDIAGRSLLPLRFQGRNATQPVSQWLWADAIFVRDLRRSDALDPRDHLKICRILHDIYFSFDFVYYFLSKHGEAIDNRVFCDSYTRFLQASDRLESRFLTIANPTAEQSR